MPVEKYVCAACGGVSPTPKNCETENCAKKGQPLDKKMECEQCGAMFGEGEEHKH